MTQPPAAPLPLIGRPLDRVDGRLKVTGAARYSAEMPAVDLAYAVLVTSTVAKGRIARLDTAAARQAAGVLTVLTHLNAPRLPEQRKANPTDKTLSLLQDDLVRYSGQPIGVVVADTLERATEAAWLVQAGYESVQPAVTLEANLSRAFVPRGRLSGGAEPDSVRGDLQQGLRDAAVHIDQTYTTPVENHNPMEPHATIAVWEGERLTLYDATQGVFSAQRRVAAALGIPAADVRIVCYFLGGGFGCKGSVWSHVVLAALAARQVGRPVKLVLTRQQMFGPVGFRPQTRQRVMLGAQRDGRLTALRHDGISQTSRFDEFVEPVAKTARMLYACPNITTSHRLVPLDTGTPTFMRAPGEASGSFALESAMDELAYALNMDPLALRLRNYTERDPEKDRPFSSKSLRACYAQAADRFGWSGRDPRPGSMREDGGRRIGWGMATATYPTNRSAASATARMLSDGTALVQSGSQDIGTGTYTVMTQIAAQILGLPVEKIRFALGDTNLPDAPVSGGSQTAASVGSAVAEAARALRDKAIALAAADEKSPLFGQAAADISAGGGRLFLTADPSRGQSYTAILAGHNLSLLEVRAETRPGEEHDRFSMHAFGAVFADVRIDPDLGMVQVARLTGAYGIGRVLNVKTARSQLIGGIIYGLGMALMEHTVTDARSGRIVTRDLADYHVPVNADVPDIDILFVDEDDSVVNPIGVKGVGEIGITGVCAAIANAVYHATGRRVRDLPITLDKLL